MVEQPRQERLRERRRGHPRAHRRRRRLPGQPLPAADVRLPDDARPALPRRGAGARQPGAVRRHRRPSGGGAARRVSIAGALPRACRRHGDVRPDQGDRPRGGRPVGQGPGRNVMIVDLVRNDLAHVAETGTVEVPSLLRVEQHPGLVHLVSTVSARLRAGCGWAELLAATSPPGSVSGAPKLSALSLISELEAVPRGVYCGAVGWVDADRKVGRLAVGIRTFAWAGGRLQLGTGAGITWGSVPTAEWEETELKVRRLLEVR